MFRIIALCLLLVAGPAAAQQSVVVPATTGQVSITGTIAAATQIVAGIAGKQIYVTQVNLIPVATAVVTFTTGTGVNCGTGTANVAGVMIFAAGQILNLGDGYGAVWVLPAGNSLCITIATAAAPGSLAFSQF